ncbi:MAG: ABC transporter ATP-binding protein [Burkholderiales bacterium]|nr:ABC transporter ATP-binding protein [Burkholderiales bacterium]
MSLPALSVLDLSKTYQKKPVLSGLHFEVRASEIFGLVGENGAGKTSLFKCLLDFCDFDAGEIRIFGDDHKNSRSRLRLSFLPERFSPPYFLTGREFLQYVLKLNESDFHMLEIEQGLRELDLNIDALNRSVRTYSKGMTQKLGLLSCFLLKKGLYILDEPMSGLDPKARSMLKRKFCSVREEGGSVFFSSHALADIEEICDRMAILHEGELRFVGTPAACREQFAAASLEQAYLQCISG